MAYGILLLRLVLGLTLAAHGAQKLFGWFGGGGLGATSTFFANLRFRAPLVMGVAAGLAEFGGGAFLAAGLLTPVAALAIVVVMVNAVALVHWKNGFFAGNGGFEFNLLILAGAVALAATGGARFSLDRALGWADNLSGLWWGVGALAAGALISVFTLTLGRRPQPASMEPARGTAPLRTA